MPRFRNILSSSAEPSSASTPPPPAYDYACITPPYSNSGFEKAGFGKELVYELERLYWLGAKAELDNIVTTLKTWRRSGALREGQTPKVPGASEGYEDFIDSVSERTRGFASKYDEMVKDAKGFENEWLYSLDWDAYQKATGGLIQHRKLRNASSKIRQDVKSRVTPVDADDNEQLAWLLLQASGFLDIDKLVEYRKQPDTKSARQQSTPQLTLYGVDEKGIPSLKPQRCRHADCHAVITSSMYIGKDSVVICERCYNLHYHGQPGFGKVYKHSPLNEVVTPVLANRICECPGVARLDGEKPTLLYPYGPADGHMNTGRHQCGLLELGCVEAKAKYEGLKAVTGEKGKEKSWTGGFPRGMAKLTTRDEASEKRTSSARKRVSAVFGSRSANGGDAKDLPTKAEGVVQDPAEDNNVPQFFRKFADKDAFSHVHMALRVGPLVIENGVGNTKDGALVTVRQTPYYNAESKRPDESLVIDGRDRSAWAQVRSETAERKRYKAIMKQVVGLPFSTLPGGGEERDIIRQVVEASEGPALPTPLTEKEREVRGSFATEKQVEEHDAMLESILEKLKAVLTSRLRTYLHSIAERLLDPGTKLTWNPTTNTCQHFCNSILDQGLFKPLFGGPPSPGGKPPLYAMSLVCPDEGYHQRVVRTKHDVAPGLAEEYFGSLYFGNHEQSDLIDATQEYWYDWAGMNGPECGHAELFPFDCTRAYAGKKEVSRNCGDCSLSRHLWAMPFDSWAMVSMHLARDPSDYPQPNHAWFSNRLEVLHAQSILCRAAAAMASSSALQSATAWMHSSSGALAQQPSLTRIKMGGIHRAQPMSHYFERGANDLYFLSAWAPMSNRAEQYRAARKERVAMGDRPLDSQDRFTKPRKQSAKDLMGSKEVYAGFEGLNVSQTCAPASKGMFKVKREHALFAAGIATLAVVSDGGDRVAGACMDSTACGAGCGDSECGSGTACGNVPSGCTGPGFHVTATCGAGFMGGCGAGNGVVM